MGRKKRKGARGRRKSRSGIRTPKPGVKHFPWALANRALHERCQVCGSGLFVYIEVEKFSVETSWVMASCGHRVVCCQECFEKYTTHQMSRKNEPYLSVPCQLHVCGLARATAARLAGWMSGWDVSHG